MFDKINLLTFFASCLILEYVSFKFVYFPSISNKEMCYRAFDIHAYASPFLFNFYHRVSFMVCLNILPEYHFALVPNMSSYLVSQ